MNPLQQMELARIDHQERLQQSQRHQAANQFEQTLQWSLPLFSQRKQAADIQHPVPLLRLGQTHAQAAATAGSATWLSVLNW